MNEVVNPFVKTTHRSCQIEEYTVIHTQTLIQLLMSSEFSKNLESSVGKVL